MLNPTTTHPPPPPPHIHRWFTLLTVLRRCPGVSLTLWCFVVYSTRRFVVCLTWGPRVKLVGRKSALISTVVYSVDRSKALVPVLILLFVALWFNLRGNLFYVLPCVILSLCLFSPFSIAITSLREERTSLGIALYACSICAGLVLSVSSFSWCLGRAAVCDCGTPFTFLFGCTGRPTGSHKFCFPCCKWLQITTYNIVFRKIIWSIYTKQ